MTLLQHFTSRFAKFSYKKDILAFAAAQPLLVIFTTSHLGWPFIKGQIEGELEQTGWILN